LNENS